MEEFEVGGPGERVKIGFQLPERLKEEIVSFLKSNNDVFVWNHEHMPGIEPSIVMHRLNADPGFRPVRQKRRTFAPERNQAVADEVLKLLSAGFVQEVDYPGMAR